MSIIVPFSRILPAVDPPVYPGSMSWTTPGTYYFTVPPHNRFNFDVYGAGGGAGGAPGWDVVSGAGATNGQYGQPGTYSEIYLLQDSNVLNLIGWGGAGGGPGFWNGSGFVSGSPNGNPGAASGGDQNITGGGDAGGNPGELYNFSGTPLANGGPGQPGGRAYRSIARGVIQWRQTLVIIVGSGGVAGPAGAVTHEDFYNTGSQPGTNGMCNISWS